MNGNRKQILDMLAAGTITADEAEQLLAALDPEPNVAAKALGGSSGGAQNARSNAIPKYLRVVVLADGSAEANTGTAINVRIPMQLLRAGVRLAALIPQQAHDKFDSALSSHGIPLTLSQIKPENLEELIEHLGDLTVDLDEKGERGTKIRVFCE